MNTTLRTLVANIGAFQREFASFEAEVASFNKRLQAGLGEVRRFERIKDLQLHLVTNFEGLGFYKSLSKMQEIVRQQSAEFGKDSGPQMIIVEPDEPLNVLKPEQMALRELLAEAAVATDPVSLVAWKSDKPEIADMPDQAWLMYACTQLLGSGLHLNFVGDPVPEVFAINEGFHDIEVCARERELA